MFTTDTTAVIVTVWRQTWSWIGRMQQNNGQCTILWVLRILIAFFLTGCLEMADLLVYSKIHKSSHHGFIVTLVLGLRVSFLVLRVRFPVSSIQQFVNKISANNTTATINTNRGLQISFVVVHACHLVRCVPLGALRSLTSQKRHW